MIEFLFVGGPAHGSILMLPDDTYRYLIPADNPTFVDRGKAPPEMFYVKYEYGRRQAIFMGETINLMCHDQSGNEKKLNALFFDALKRSKLHHA